MPLLKADGINFDCEAVLFDKDGTLIDFKYMWLEWSRYVLDELTSAAGLKAGQRSLLERSMGINLAEWYVDPGGPLAGGSMTGLRESMAGMLVSAGVAEQEANRLLLDTIRRSEEAMNWKTLASPIPGLHPVLEMLRGSGFKLAVVTADSSERAKISLTSLKLIDYFDAVLGADCVINSKPAPDMAVLACRMLGVVPDRAVVVGDTPQDMQMAGKAGSPAIGVLSGVCTRVQLKEADAVIDSVADLRIKS